MRRICLFLAVFGVYLLAAERDSHADLIVDFNEVGGSVVCTVTGSIDLTGIFNVGDVPETLSVRPNTATFYVGSASGIAHEHYFVPAAAGRSGPLSIGGGGFTAATFGGGDFIGFTANGGDFNIYLPENYVSNSSVTGSATFTGHNFVSLGIDPGIHTWVAGANTITATVSAVPEPSSLAILLLVSGGMTVIRFRKRVVGNRACSPDC